MAVNDQKASELSLATSLNDNDKFLIIVADSSSETGYTNKIVNSSTLKATYGGGSGNNNNPAIVLPLDASDPTKIDYSKLSAMTGATTDSLLLIKADGTIGKMTISAVRGSGASAGAGSGTPSTGGTSNANQLDFSEVGGILASTDTDMALILREDGSLKKVSVNDLKGEGTLTTNYMTLDEEVGTTYRITVGNDGNLKAVKNNAYTATPPTATQNTNFHGLLINSMYGAGTATTGMPISHNFIELYNNTATEKNLEGLHLWYKDTTTYTTWEGLALHGCVPPYTSFLVVGGQCANRWDTDCRHFIEHYDQRWMAGETGLGMKFSDNGFSVYLSATGDTPPETPDAFTKNPDGSYTTNKTENFIDLMGGGGLTSAPPAFNLFYRSPMTNKVGLRKIDFFNRFKIKDFSNYIATDHCTDDYEMTELVNFKTCHKGKFPKSTYEGHWNMFDNYIDMFDKEGVNYFNLGLGEEETTRTFCFQMKASREDGYVWYRKKGETSWNQFLCTTTKWHHPNFDVNIYKAIVHDLELGVTYEYKVGTEATQSGVHEFYMFDKDISTGDTVRFLFTSDPQSWTVGESDTYRNICYKILDDWEAKPDGTPNFDFWFSGGDEVQNGNRVNPEFYTINKARREARWEVPFLTTIGNNDLYLKKFSDLYQVNFCTEQSNPAHNWSGFYHCRIDDLLFVSYSSNEDLNYVAGQGGSNSDDPICGGFSTWDEFLAKEAEALEELLNPIVNGVNPPQWIIFTCHQMPITCVRQAKMQKFIPVIEKYADLHIGGHQHCFSKCFAPIYSNIYSGLL